MKIQISNVKGIKNLTFEIPQVGVWVITGLNGSGKSTLLATLDRIKNANAFQQFFRTSPLADQVDLYDNASIEYEIDGQSVTYKYGGQRWRATPRANSVILGKFPFSDIEYIPVSYSHLTLPTKRIV